MSVGLLSFCSLCCALFLLLEALVAAEALVSWMRLVPKEAAERRATIAAAGFAIPAAYVLLTVPFLYGDLIPDQRKL